MANVQSYDYPGWGTYARKNFHYTQAVRIGDRILCSGQGGWDGKAEVEDPDKVIKPDLMDEIDQAFENCDYNLKHAGGKGWSQVYKIVTYSTDVQSQMERIVYNMRKWMPDHSPLWTLLGVKELGIETMHFEIDVEALDEEGAAEARKAKAATS